MAFNAASVDEEDEDFEPAGFDETEMGARPPAGGFGTVLGRIHLATKSLDRRRVLALLIAIGVAITVGRSLDRARATVSQLGQGVPTLVATAPIARGDRVDQSNTLIAQWPPAFRPDDATDSMALGQAATAPIAAGQAISAGQLSPDRHGLATGERAVTIPTPLAPPPLVVGDVVEVVGIEGFDGLVRASVLTTAIVSELSDETITLALPRTVATVVIRFLASGALELTRVPDG